LILDEKEWPVKVVKWWREVEGNEHFILEGLKRKKK